MDEAETLEIGGAQCLQNGAARAGQRLAPGSEPPRTKRGCPGGFVSGHSNGMIAKL